MKICMIFSPQPNLPPGGVRLFGQFFIKKEIDMKKMTGHLAFLASLALLVSVAFSGCLKDKCTSTMTYKIWKPIVKSLADIRQEIAAAEPLPLKKPGQMYLLGSWLLIGEQAKGIHIFDNSNPDDPKNVAFINLPGAVDMAVKDGFLYADNYIDLVVVDIKNPLQPSLVRRVENVFPFAQFSDGGYIIGYEETDETQIIDCNSGYWGRNYFNKNGELFASIDVAFDGSGFNSQQNFDGGQPSTGIGGSFARFTVVGDHLYTVDTDNLRSFNVAVPSSPQQVGTTALGSWQVETLFPVGSRLFIGSQNGLFVYETATNPAQPTKLCEFTHARACDPVVADGSTAYVTLFDGSACLGFQNQLDVIDIQDITLPKLTKTYQLTRPQGVGIRQNLLFVCDDGLKIFDRTDPLAIDQNLLAHVKNLQVRDVIPVPWSNDLILTSPLGIFQFDATDPKAIRQRSLIAVEN